MDQSLFTTALTIGQKTLGVFDCTVQREKLSAAQVLCPAPRQKYFDCSTPALLAPWVQACHYAAS